MMALPACSPGEGLRGNHTGSIIPALHSTIPEPFCLQALVSLYREVDASRMAAQMEVSGRKSRSRDRTTLRGPMVSLEVRLEEKGEVQWFTPSDKLQLFFTKPQSVLFCSVKICLSFIFKTMDFYQKVWST